MPAPLARSILRDLCSTLSHGGRIKGHYLYAEDEACNHSPLQVAETLRHLGTLTRGELDVLAADLAASREAQVYGWGCTDRCALCEKVMALAANGCAEEARRVLGKPLQSDRWGHPTASVLQPSVA